MRAAPNSLRLTNQARLVEQLLRRGIATRAELAKAGGMSQPTGGKIIHELATAGGGGGRSRPTAGKIIDELSTAGVVEELTGPSEIRGRPQVGRPGKQLRLSQ